ncbi:MAG: glutamate--tRNA ligase [Proteobacteria bacterium]|nr:glutamate--tRNA ligase [Pseudomonadota bacterium]
MTLRVRFAPSPTGHMHVGHLRAALPNVLLALKQQGTLILRFEDTDLERNKAESEQSFLEDLAWLGFTFHEGPFEGGPVGPYRTVERAERGDYAAAVQKLMASGRAYECFTTPEELDLLRKIQTGKGEPPRYDNRHRNLSKDQREAFRAEGRPSVIRFKLADEPITFPDLIRGEQTFQPQNLGGDPVIVRSNGIPLFTFAGCVDDIAMNITHVIRGEDHITNAATQVQLYQALGATPPQFAHISLMLDKDGHKMSKRLGALTIGQLRKQGYLPNAILSYMAGLGLGEAPRPGATLAELAENFDFSRCGKAPVRFDEDQLLHTNTHALHHAQWAEVAAHAAPFFPMGVEEPQQRTLWPLVREGLKTLADVGDATQPIITAPQQVNLPDADKPFIADALAALPKTFTDTTWAEWTTALKAKTGRKGKELFMPLRRVLTGQDHGPELAALLPLWGHAEVSARLQRCL